MVSIGEPLAVLNRDGLITHPYLRQCDAYPRPSSSEHFGSRKNKQNNRRACLRQGGMDNYFLAATSGAKRPQRQALARGIPAQARSRGKRKEWAAQSQAIGSGRRCSERDVNPLEADLGRNDSLVRLVEPRLQALHPLGDGGEVATEAGNHRFDGVVDIVLVDRGQAPVAHDHGAIDDDVAHAAPGLDVNELSCRAVERRPARIAHVDEREIRLVARRDPPDDTAEARALRTGYG